MYPTEREIFIYTTNYNPQKKKKENKKKTTQRSNKMGENAKKLHRNNVSDNIFPAF